ncbi:MAG: hypothetical protein EB010_08635 [Acidimicrobiia bacterium]|nr:hypothetical protein [Acidimicrobiia bacterium]
MKRHSVSAITVSLVASLGLITASCGDDPDASARPILVVTGSGAGINAPAAANDMAAGAESKMWAPWQMKFIAGADLPALDSEAKSYVISGGSVSVSDISNLAAVFGVAGDVEEVDANMGGGYRIGSDNGSTDSFWVSGDALHYWSYSPKWNESAVVGCAIASSPDGSVTTEPVDCARPEPPANVPSDEEARALFATLIEKMNLNADDMVLESYADEWGASVYAYLKIDGVRSPLTVSVGFGADGAVTFASGFLGEIIDGASYPRIGTTAGLERLNSDYANPMVRGGVAVNDVVAIDVASASSAGVAVSAEGQSGSSVEVATPDTAVPVPETVVPVPAPDVTVIDPSTIPVDSVPVEMPIEVQEITIVAVEEELVMLYGADGSIYLVPGYAFIAAEDVYGYTPRYTVSAMPDEYVQQADPIDVSIEPAIDEPVPSDPVATEVSAAEAERLIGLSESAALDTAKVNGWEARVVSRDGVDLAVTMDYRMDRVNLTIVDDKVTASTVG